MRQTILLAFVLVVLIIFFFLRDWRATLVAATAPHRTLVEPVHQLDVVLGQDLGRGFKLGLKARNLLDLPVRRTQGGRESDAYRIGRSFSLSLSWRI